MEPIQIQLSHWTSQQKAAQTVIQTGKSCLLSATFAMKAATREQKNLFPICNTTLFFGWSRYDFEVGSTANQPLFAFGENRLS